MEAAPCILRAIGLAALSLGAGEAENHPGAQSAPPAWRFVAPGPGADAAIEHAPFRALALSRSRPEDVHETAHYRGAAERRRYAQLRFGSPGSVRVTVVLDVTVSGDADLYVDSNRNRRIDDRDRVAPLEDGRRRVWRVPLDVAMVEKDVVHKVPRILMFRAGGAGRTLACASAGHVEGSVELNGEGQPSRRVAARRTDGDADGQLAGAQDRIWLDLNGDGRFDPSAEQFLFAPVLNVEGERRMVRADALGDRLSIAPLTDAGTLRLAWAGPRAKDAKQGEKSDSKPPAVRAELHATAIGRDGSVFGLDGAGPSTVPAGEYRLGTVNVSIDDAQGGPRWSYVFSTDGDNAPTRWYRVADRADVTIDPIGALRFEIELNENEGAAAENAAVTSASAAVSASAPAIVARPGSDINVRPDLRTGDGLIINACYRGGPAAPTMQETESTRIALQTESGRALAEARSGFS